MSTAEMLDAQYVLDNRDPESRLRRSRVYIELTEHQTECISEGGLAPG